MSEVEDLFSFHNLHLDSITEATVHGRECRMLHLTYCGKVPETCPECGARLYKHGQRTVTAYDMPRAGCPVRLEITLPRKRCSSTEHKHIWRPYIQDIDEKHKMTKRALFHLTEKSMRTTFEDTALTYALTANTVKNAFVDFFEGNRKNLRFRAPVFLGMAEIKIKHMGDVTVITDLEHRTLFDMIKGRSQKQLLGYLTELPHHEEVLLVCADMYRPFEKTIADVMPNARWVSDHFHLTEGIRRLIRENSIKGRGYSFEVLRARTLYRSANLRAMLEKGSVNTVGPVIP